MYYIINILILGSRNINWKAVIFAEPGMILGYTEEEGRNKKETFLEEILQDL